MLVVHENTALLECSQLEIFCSLGVQGKQILEDLCVYIHGSGLVLGLLHLLFVFKVGGPGLEVNVGLQPKHYLVVVEDCLWGQLHELLFLFGEHIYHASLNQHHFVWLSTRQLDRRIRQVVASVQLDDEFVAETILARVEEVLEFANEVLENLIYQLRLHRWSKLLVQ